MASQHREGPDRVRALLAIDYHQYYISGSPADTGPGDVGEIVQNGLVGVESIDQACVTAGVQSGNLWLTVERWHEPPPLDPDAWDEVAELSYIATCETRILEWRGDFPSDFPDLAVAGPGDYRVRVHARGRDAYGDPEDDYDDDDPAEEHLIQMWAAPRAAEIIHKATDLFGRLWRDES